MTARRLRPAAAALAAGLAVTLATALLGLRPDVRPGAPVAARGLQELEEAYRLVDTWDAGAAQGAPGSVLFPAGIDATDDRVVLVDRGNHRVQSFAPDGAFLAAWGQRGSGPGDLLEPRDVAVDGSRTLVTDSGNRRVVVFGASGTPIASWPVEGDAEPWGIASRGGRTVVTVPRQREILVLRADGSLEARWAGGVEPMGASIGVDGRVYVADRAASVVRVFGPDGTALPALTTNLPPIDVAVDSLGDLYVQSAGAVLWYPAGSSTSRQAMYYDGMQGVAVHTRHGVYATVARTDVRRAPSFHGVVRYRWQPLDGLPQEEWRLRGFPPGRLSAPHAVHVGPSGTIWVLDEWPRIQGFDPAGRVTTQIVPETTTGIAPVDVAESPTGELIVGETRRLLRIGRTGAISQTVRLGYGTTSYWLTGLAWRDAHPGVSLLDSSLLYVRDYGVTRTLQPVGGWPLSPPGPWRLFWDLAVPAPGTLDTVYLANRSEREIWVMQRGVRTAVWDVDGVVARLAVGPDGAVFALTAEGLVYKHAPDGRVVAIWDAGAYSAGASKVADLDVDRQGRVYTVDSEANTVRVWEVDPDSPPEPPSALPGACRLRADKRAEPEALRIGEQVTVRLQVGGECPSAKPFADIVLAIDRSGSMNDSDQITATRKAAATFIDEVDLTRDRVAVVAFNNTAQVVQPLTDNREQALAAVASIDAVGGTDIAQAFTTSAGELFGPRSRPEAQPVIVLLTDGRDREPDEALDASRYAQSRGARVFTIGFGDVDPMVMVLSASAPEDHYYAPDTSTLNEIYTEIAQRITASVLARSMTVVDELPSDMRYVEGSARPPASYDAATRLLTWQLSDVPLAGIALEYRVEPQVLGRRPTNVRAEAQYVDGLNSQGRLRFPVPEVDVLTLEPTATPTSTPFPTPTPPPTRTPLPPEPLFLPIAVRQHCRGLSVHADVAIVMDTSSSMREESSPGGASKLEMATAAARTFVGLLAFPGDQAAVVRFDRDAAVEQRLTSNAEALHGALSRLRTGQGTRIDLGIAEATSELLGERHAEGNNRVIVLLTDGRTTGATDADVLAEAAAAKAAGILVYTIGLGADVDAALLRDVAGSGDAAFLAPTTAELEEIYRSIAYTIACPGLTWP